VIVEPVVLDSLDVWRGLQTGACFPFKRDLNRWLAEHGGRAPVATLADVLRGRRFHPSVEKRLESAEVVERDPDADPACRARDRFRERLRAGVLAAMDAARVDALVYPTWSNPPRLIGDLNTPHGDNNQLFSPSTGFPAVTVPMGYLRGGILPAGLQFFGRPWSEEVLLRLAYGYEQATRHRRPPASTPPLR
jgi:amidase